MPSPRRLLLACAALGATLAVAGPASAAVTFGSNLKHVPNALACGGSCAQSFLPVASQAAGGVVAPSDGVVVRWRFRNTGDPVHIVPRVFSGNTGGAAGDAITAPTVNAVLTYPTRLPVKAGDVFGFDNSGIGVPAYTDAGAGSVTAWNPALAPGETRAPFVTGSDLDLLINADVEPDADHDGYGDQSQDQCPSDASAHGACPVPTPPATTPPATTPPVTTQPTTGGETPTPPSSGGDSGAPMGSGNSAPATDIPPTVATLPTVVAKKAAKKCARKRVRRAKGHSARKHKARCSKAKRRHRKHA